MADIKSESVADFIPESVADFARNTHAGFQHGSLRYIAEFPQRGFQLGGAIWLPDRVGLRPWLAAALVTVGLVLAELAALGRRANR
jgi:hypothetical protein